MICPRGLIAHYPLLRRSSSRLLVVDRKTQRFSHAKFSDLNDLLRRGDLMVLNNTKVIPARLTGYVERRGIVEFLLTEKKAETQWKVLFRKPTDGLQVKLDGGVWGSLKKEPDKSWTIRFSEPIERIIASTGRMPLPPYITREPEPSDKKTYQTVYATEEGAVAAPTAGLHFDLELLSSLREKGVLMKYVTLHVGEGTFRPVKEELIDNHVMHSERISVPRETAEAVNEAKAEKRKIISVGTTVTRTLESAGSGGRQDTAFFRENGSFHKASVRISVCRCSYNQFPYATLNPSYACFRVLRHDGACPRRLRGSEIARLQVLELR